METLPQRVGDCAATGGVGGGVAHRIFSRNAAATPKVHAVYGLLRIAAFLAGCSARVGGESRVPPIVIPIMYDDLYIMYFLNNQVVVAFVADYIVNLYVESLEGSTLV
jgi:hypothetical protein